MKQFIKALDRDGDCFHYICSTFPRVSDEKKKPGIFDGPQIRTLLKDKNFMARMTAAVALAWLAFTNVVQGFLRNKKDDNYKEIVDELLLSLRGLGCRMSIKLHYLHSHLDKFLDNFGDVSEEQGERFHQDIKVMKDMYQGRWDSHMMSDYCWSLMRANPDALLRGRHQKENLPQTEMICVSTNQTTLLLHIFWLDITFSVNVIMCNYYSHVSYFFLVL